MSTKCITGKRIYTNYKLAEEALIGAHIAYEYAKGRGPLGVYQCDDCCLYHLTSQGEVNPRLKEMLENGEIQKQKDAQWWEGRFKRK